MTERATVTVGPWPDSGATNRSAGLVSMSTSTFEKLIDELGRQSEEVARLHAALAVRPSVSLAAGVIMSRYGLHEKAAFDLLSSWADQNEVRLRDLACAVLEVAARDPEAPEVDYLRGLPPREARP